MAQDARQGQEEEVQNERQLSTYQKVEALLLDQLSAEESVIKKLVADARRSPRSSREFLDDLEAILREHGLSRLSTPTEWSWWDLVWPGATGGEAGVEHYEALDEDGDRAVVIKRYLAKEHRGPGEVTALENVLRSLSRGDAHFLRVFAKTHSPGGLSGDEDAEVMIMLEPFSGTLREYLTEHDVSLPKRLALFASIMDSVNHLHRNRVPHNSLITADNVLVMGDLANSTDTSVVLCPSILNTELRVCSTQQALWSWVAGADLPEGVVARSAFEADEVRQLGELLDWMLRTFRDHDSKDNFFFLVRDMMSGEFDQLGRARLAFLSCLFRAIQNQALHEAISEKLGLTQSLGSLGTVGAWDETAHSSNKRLRRTSKRLAALARRARADGLRLSSLFKVAGKLGDDGA